MPETSHDWHQWMGIVLVIRTIACLGFVPIAPVPVNVAAWFVLAFSFVAGAYIDGRRKLALQAEIQADFMKWLGREE